MVWLRPKKLERILKSQGFNGNKYKLFFGDMKELFSLQSKSSQHNKQIIDIDNGEEVLSNVMAFPYQALKKHGNFLFYYTRINKELSFILEACEVFLLPEMIGSRKV